MEKIRKQNWSVHQFAPQNTNTVIVRSGARAVIFDPWGDCVAIACALSHQGAELTGVYLTHAHFDHYSAMSDLLKSANAKWFLHEKDLPLIDWSNGILRSFGGAPIDIKKHPPEFVAEGKVEILPGIFARVIHLPGHSPGSIAYYIESEKLLIAGDVIFADGYGRTDLPGGDPAAIVASLSKLRALNLPDDTTVIHGHGKETTIGWLKGNNRFFCDNPPRIL